MATKPPTRWVGQLRDDVWNQPDINGKIIIQMAAKPATEDVEYSGLIEFNQQKNTERLRSTTNLQKDLLHDVGS